MGAQDGKPCTIKKDTRIFLIVLGIVSIVAIGLLIYRSIGSKDPVADVNPADSLLGLPGSSVETRLPNVPALLKDHYWLQNRRNGSCQALKGDVIVTVVFYSDEDAAWTEEAIRAQTWAIRSELSYLEEEAQRYGAKLRLTTNCVEATGDALIAKSAGAGEKKAWFTNLFRSLDFGDSVGAVNAHLKSQFLADEVPVLLFYAGGGRAYSTTIANQLEVGVLYQNNSKHAFLHELFHMFGAADYYTPDWVVELFKQYYDESVMLDSSDSAIDSLTAYLIGWTDELTTEAKLLLLDTAEIQENSYPDDSGYSVGKKTYANGNVYEGEFYDGYRHGKGTFYFANGAYYKGEFEHGQITGYGVYHYKDGGVYEGNFVDGLRSGFGEYRSPDGTVKKGTWRNDKFLG